MDQIIIIIMRSPFKLKLQRIHFAEREKLHRDRNSIESATGFTCAAAAPALLHLFFLISSAGGGPRRGKIDIVILISHLIFSLRAENL